jgi:hypothetical protein
MDNMRRYILVAGLIVLTTTALAQEQPPSPANMPYAPIEEQAWRDMSTFFYSLSMPGPAHAAIQEYMQRIERDAQMKQMRMKQTEGRK